MQGKILIKNKAQGERAVKGLLKTQTAKKVDTETGIPGAGKQMEALQKEITSLKKSLSGLSLTVGKLWKDKVEREMRDDPTRT